MSNIGIIGIFGSQIMNLYNTRFYNKNIYKQNVVGYDNNKYLNVYSLYKYFETLSKSIYANRPQSFY